MGRLWIGLMSLALGALALAQPGDGDDLFHTVEAGDTLISIAHAYGVTLEQLLTLNELRPESLLQIGQRLLVMRAPAFSEDSGEPDAPEGEAPTAEAEVGGSVERADWPPAPVADADAPMRDPADIRPRLCFAVYEDANENGMLDAGEALLGGATLRLLDETEVERLRYTTTGADEPHCPRELERRLYTLAGEAPPGFGLTGSPRLRVDLRSGGRVDAAFGAKRGMESAAPPPPEPPSGDDARETAERSPLRELSGLFALGLAAVVFFGGLAVSIVLRWR